MPNQHEPIHAKDGDCADLGIVHHETEFVNDGLDNRINAALGEASRESIEQLLAQAFGQFDCDIAPQSVHDDHVGRSMRQIIAFQVAYKI